MYFVEVDKGVTISKCIVIMRALVFWEIIFNHMGYADFIAISTQMCGFYQKQILKSPLHQINTEFLINADYQIL